MANVLTKDAPSVIVITPAIAADPGTPGIPAWDETVLVTGYVIGPIIAWQSTVGVFTVYVLGTPRPPIPYHDPITGVTVSYWSPIFAPGHIATYTTVVHHPAVIAVPGHPAVAAETAVVKNVGWNAGAVSVDSIVGDGEYQFSIDPSSVGIVTGFNDNNLGASYIDIDHALYFDNGVFRVMERGVRKTGTALFDADDVFTIARVGSQVRYFQNDTLFYTSLLRSFGRIFADSSLYFAGDNIVDASLGTAVANVFRNEPVSGSGSFTLQSIGANFSYAEGHGSFELTSHGDTSSPGGPGGTYDPHGPGGALDPDGHPTGLGDDGNPIGGVSANWGTGSFTLQSMGADGAFADGRGSFTVASTGAVYDAGTVGSYPDGYGLGSFTVNGNAYAFDSETTAYAFGRGSFSVRGDASAMLEEPQYVEGRGEFQFASFGYVDFVNNATGSGSFALQSIGANFSYAEGRGSFAVDGFGFDQGFQESRLYVDMATSEPSLLAILNVGPPGSLIVSLHPSAPTLQMVGAMEVSLVAAEPSLSMTGFIGGYLTADLIPSDPSLAMAGTVAPILDVSLSPSAPSLSAALTCAAFLDTELVPSEPSLAMTATLSQFLNVSLLPSAPSLSMLGGMEVNLVPESNQALHMTGFVGGVTRVLLEIEEEVSLVASLVQGSVLYVDLRPSEPSIVPVMAVALLPSGISLVAEFTTGTATYEGYSLTLLPTPEGLKTLTTRIATCPFVQILRWGDAYYGIATDGIYELTGDTFAGDPIIASVKTAQDDFGTMQMKRPRTVSVAGIVGTDFKAAVEVHELSQYQDCYQGSGFRSHRAKLPRGVRRVRLAYAFTNEEGEDFSINALTPENDIQKRTLGE